MTAATKNHDKFRRIRENCFFPRLDHFFYLRQAKKETRFNKSEINESFLLSFFLFSYIMMSNTS